MTRLDKAEVWDFVAAPVDAIPRAATPDELAGLAALHDRLIIGPGLAGVQLVGTSGHAGEAGKPVGKLLFPIGSRSVRLVAALYCAGHTPGTLLAESHALGRELEGRLFIDDAPGYLWGEAPHLVCEPKPTFH